KYTALEKQIKQMHKYQIPEIIAIEINQGSSEYLNWINSTMLE
ncbi:MAG: CutA1 divalent ion tolerance protein, partial [Pseudomonadota bacterium]